MKTVSPPSSIGTVPPERRGDVDDFIDVVRKEQARFLDTIRQAASSLPADAGELARIAANQSRLTQQFFDAQRSILMRRAEFDAEVMRIDRLAEDEAAAVVRSAHGSTLLTEGIQGDGIPMGDVIDAAFVRTETDDALAQRQLASLLDEWWSAENQEGRAMIDDAHARAAMRRRFALIEAGEIMEAASHAEPWSAAAADPERGIVLPEQVLAVLDADDLEDLDSLLSALAESLDPTRAAGPPTIEPRNDDLVIRLDLPRSAVAEDVEVPTAPVTTGRMLSKLRRSAASSDSFGWIPVRTVVPMAAATSALALAMAWLG